MNSILSFILGLLAMLMSTINKSMHSRDAGWVLVIILNKSHPIDMPLSSKAMWEEIEAQISSQLFVLIEDKIAIIALGKTKQWNTLPFFQSFFITLGGGRSELVFSYSEKRLSANWSHWHIFPSKVYSLLFSLLNTFFPMIILGGSNWTLNTNIFMCFNESDFWNSPLTLIF